MLCSKLPLASVRSTDHVTSKAFLTTKPGVNVIQVLHLYFTRVAIVSLAENNSCTCKLQV